MTETSARKPAPPSEGGVGWRIIEGDVLDRLADLEDGSVQCCVTSPPYFGLRDYGMAGQIGLEPSVGEFVGKLVAVFAEVRRVLRDDGTLWLNLGDSYANDGKWGGSSGGKHVTALHGNTGVGRQKVNTGLKPKDLIGIPWRVAFALQADGWWLRAENIWAKPNPMPESVTDRPTRSHEQVFLLSKRARYFYDANAVRENAVSDHPSGNGYARPERESYQNPDGTARGQAAGWTDVGGRRNRRTVWTIATQPYPDAHFATFPLALVEPCVLAGTSPKACGECGTPWRRVVDVTYENPGNRATNGPRSIDRRHLDQGSAGYAQRLERRTETLGWESGCEHDDDAGRCLVLDPFAGSGTVGVVAGQLDRSFVGIELNGEYAAMARRRITREGRPGDRKHEPTMVGDGQLALIGAAPPSSGVGECRSPLAVPVTPVSTPLPGDTA